SASDSWTRRFSRPRSRWCSAERWCFWLASSSAVPDNWGQTLWITLMSTFQLAHLSDAHISPLPRPRFAELLGKRAVGFANWLRKRRLVHRADVLRRIVEHLKSQSPDHIAVTGDLVNLSLADEFKPARAFL